MRIKFLANTPLRPHTAENGACAVNINMAYFMMKHYHDLLGQSKPTWLTQEFIMQDSAETQAQRCLDQRVDMLLLSCFVWNMDLQMRVAEQYRRLNPQAVIVMGGPQLVAHKDPEFFQRHPFVDYAVYGDGERALSQIIDHHMLATPQTGWVNIAENRDGTRRLWPYEVLRVPEYWASSPYLGQQQFIRDNLSGLYQHGFTSGDVMIAVEFARGCMYSCAFCDWSQNLTKKVTRRDTNWRAELQFFKELDVQLRETDANFGSWEQDVEIYDYARSIYDPKKHFKFLAWNTAKLKKNAYHFLIHNAQTYGQRVLLSLQDTDPAVLKLMQRPSLSWEQHKDMIAHMKHRLGEEKFSEVTGAQLMLGTPGQSLQTFRDNFIRLFEIGLYDVSLAHWVLLPNSPGADPTYQQTHGIEWMEHKVPNTSNDRGTLDLTGLSEVYETAHTSTQFTNPPKVWRTSTMTTQEIIAVKIAMVLFEGPLKKQLHKQRDLTGIVDAALATGMRHALKQLELHRPFIDRYRFVVPGTIGHDQFYTDWAPLTG